jgi:hypothetical protein
LANGTVKGKGGDTLRVESATVSVVGCEVWVVGGKGYDGGFAIGLDAVGECPVDDWGIDRYNHGL